MGYYETHKYNTGHDSDVGLAISLKKGEFHQVLPTGIRQRKVPGENR